MTQRASPEMLVFLGGAALGLLAFYSFVLYREGRQAYRLTARQVFLLWGLRIGIALLVLIALARPAYEKTRVEERLPVVPLLVDESLSMVFPDSRDNSLIQADAPDRRTRYHAAQNAVQHMQERLSQTHRVRVYTFSDARKLLREIPSRSSADEPVLAKEELFRAWPQPTGNYSNIGDALAETLRELATEKIASVVVLSDGRQTGGLSLTEVGEQAATAQVPIHTITLGSEHPLRDLRIDEVVVGAEASLGDVLTFHVRVTNQISAPLATELTLEEKDAEDQASAFQRVTRRSLTLPRGQQVVSISMIPETEGLRKCRLELPRQADEVNTANNLAEVTVKVVKRTLKVLLIAGQPSREYYYVVPALLRDPIIDLACYLQGADVDYVQQGNTGIDQLPATLKEWSRYDVAILFDVDPNGITTQQLGGLENMVRNGGGLMVVAGRNHGLAKLVQVHPARIRGLLPVEVDKNLPLDHDRVYDRPFQARRTVPGKGHPVFLASTDAAINEQTWTSFEALDHFWHHPIQGLKPQAISLLERAGDGGAPESLMAIQRYGDGAVFFSALDGLWRWRFPAESYDYDRLWTRVIRYLGEARLLGTQKQVALSTDRRSYNPGEEVQLGLRLLDPALSAQLSGQSLFVTVTGEGGDRYMVPLGLDLKEGSLYRGTYRARRVGTLVAHARQNAPDAASEAKPLFDVKHRFEIRIQSLEDIDTSADLDGMAALARRTGGQALDYRNMQDLEQLTRSMPTEPQVLHSVTVHELWDGVALLALFLILAAGELVLRKWWGLL